MKPRRETSLKSFIVPRLSFRSKGGSLSLETPACQMMQILWWHQMPHDEVSKMIHPSTPNVFHQMNNSQMRLSVEPDSRVSSWSHDRFYQTLKWSYREQFQYIRNSPKLIETFGFRPTDLSKPSCLSQLTEVTEEMPQTIHLSSRNTVNHRFWEGIKEEDIVKSQNQKITFKFFKNFCVHPNSKANRLFTECVFLSTSFHKAKLATVSSWSQSHSLLVQWRGGINPKPACANFSAVWSVTKESRKILNLACTHLTDLFSLTTPKASMSSENLKYLIYLYF